MTEIVLVVDRSGSMEAIKEDARGAVNQFLEEQKAVDGDARVTLVTFNTEYTSVVEGRDIDDVEPLAPEDYRPGGMTALLDAVGRTIDAVGERLAETPEDERPAKVAFAVMTDGLENSSKEYVEDGRVKEMIEHQSEKYGWEFFFLGANVDAFAEAQKLGIPKRGTMNFGATAQGVRAASAAVSGTVAQYRGGQAYDLSQHDQGDENGESAD